MAPKNFSDTGIVVVCAPADAARLQASFPGVNRVNILLKKLENKRMPHNAP